MGMTIEEQKFYERNFRAMTNVLDIWNDVNIAINSLNNYKDKLKSYYSTLEKMQLELCESDNKNEQWLSKMEIIINNNEWAIKALTLEFNELQEKIFK